ncbi:MAG TPA: AraC family transcriptional regulator [Lysobacter sp.]|nr:AraC family transcriptional regulator [Lysobacter sp.]
MAAALPPSPAGLGRVLMWRGGSLWVSRDTGRAAPHAHHAIQITLAPLAAVRIRTAADAIWHEARASILMPDHAHEFDGGGQPVAIVFVEPESLAGRALIARYGCAPFAAIVDEHVLACACELLHAFAQGADEARLIRGAQQVVARIAGHVAMPAPLDPRIAAAVEWLRERIDRPVTLAQAASVAHLSPSRFRHLFVAQTGVSFRAYLLWARVNRAIVRGMAGASWTEAAQASGFADSAHLSRTCRRMFGIAPSMLARE